jgi:hypothetical protein
MVMILASVGILGGIALVIRALLARRRRVEIPALATPNVTAAAEPA